MLSKWRHEQGNMSNSNGRNCDVTIFPLQVSTSGLLSLSESKSGVSSSLTFAKYEAGSLYFFWCAAACSKSASDTTAMKGETPL